MLWRSSMCVIPCATIYFICACFMTWHIPHRWLHFNLLFGRWRKRCIDHSSLVSLALIWACVALASESTVVGVLTLSVFINHAACYLALLEECCIPLVLSGGKLLMRFASIDDWCFHHPYPTLCGILDVERHPSCFVLVVFLGCRMSVCLCSIHRTGHRTHMFVFLFYFCHRWEWTSLCFVFLYGGMVQPVHRVTFWFRSGSPRLPLPHPGEFLLSFRGDAERVSTWQVDEISFLVLPPWTFPDPRRDPCSLPSPSPHLTRRREERGSDFPVLGRVGTFLPWSRGSGRRGRVVRQTTCGAFETHVTRRKWKGKERTWHVAPPRGRSSHGTLRRWTRSTPTARETMERICVGKKWNETIHRTNKSFQSSNQLPETKSSGVEDELETPEGGRAKELRKRKKRMSRTSARLRMRTEVEKTAASRNALGRR